MAGIRAKSLPAGLLTSLILSILAPVVVYLLAWPLEGIDCKLYDFKFSYSKKGPTNPQIVHLDVDDKSIKEFGPWPWDREISGRIVDRLTKLGAGVIVFDILFASQGRSKEGNEAFFKSIANSGRVVSATAFGVTRSTDFRIEVEGERNRGDALYDVAWPLKVPPDADYYRVRRLSDAYVPLVPIIENSKAIGHIKSTPDPDGVHRRIPMIVGLEDRCVPSLSLAALLVHLNISPGSVDISTPGEIIVKHDGGAFRIPVDPSGSMCINWVGAKEFPKFPVSDLFTEDYEAKAPRYKDKMVIVAVTFTGAGDIGVSPVSNESLLSRIHSSALQTILMDRHIHVMPLFPWAATAATMLAIAFSFLCVRMRLVHAIATALGIVVFFAVLSVVSFSRWSWEIPFAAPLIIFAVPAAAGLIHRGVYIEAKARRSSSALQRYLSPEMLEMIVSEEREVDLSTKRKELSILFVDVRGFSTISERVEVEYLEEFLNDFFEAMTLAVFENHGTVDKFLGDGLLAFFGDPVKIENHALAAVKAGLKMHREVEKLNAKWSSMGVAELENGIRIRVGINTGVVVVGNIGSARRMEYTVLGSAVNVARRLEESATPGTVLASARTCALARDSLRCGEAKKIKVKGIDREIAVCEVESVADGPSA